MSLTDLWLRMRGSGSVPGGGTDSVILADVSRKFSASAALALSRSAAPQLQQSAKVSLLWVRSFHILLPVNKPGRVMPSRSGSGMSLMTRASPLHLGVRLLQWVGSSESSAVLQCGPLVSPTTVQPGTG